MRRYQAELEESSQAIQTGTGGMVLVSPWLERTSCSPKHSLVFPAKRQGETSITSQEPGSGQTSVEEERDGIVGLRDLVEVVVGIS